MTQGFSYRRFLLQETLDKLLEVVALAYPAVWLVLSVYNILFVNPFGRTPMTTFPLPITPPKIHSLTVLALSSFYLFTYYNLDYLLTPVRVVLSWGLTVLGVTFYDFSWSVCEVLSVGKGSFLTPLIPFLGTAIIVVYYGRKNQVFKVHRMFFVVSSSFVVSMVLLVLSGFYVQFHAFLAGEAADPHGWLWAAGKFLGVWMWSQTYYRRGGSLEHV